MPDPNPQMERPPAGIVAEFAAPEKAAEAARRLRAEGFRDLDAYGPFPCEELASAIGFREHRVAPCVLAGGILGALAGFGLQYYATVLDYPHKIGGRPLFSWPAFIPVTFECTVLFAALAGIAALLFLNRLPRLAHPVFSAAHFDQASTDHFFVAAYAGRLPFPLARAREILESFAPLSLSVLEPEDES